MNLDQISFKVCVGAGAGIAVLAALLRRTL